MVTRKETGSRGGTMLPQAASYQELTAKFRWQVPEHYNIGVDACDKWAQGKEGSGRLALIHLAEDGRETRYSFRSEEHTSELQSLMRLSYAVFCLKKKKNQQ